MAAKRNNPPKHLSRTSLNKKSIQKGVQWSSAFVLPSFAIRGEGSGEGLGANFGSNFFWCFRAKMGGARWRLLKGQSFELLWGETTGSSKTLGLMDCAMVQRSYNEGNGVLINKPNPFSESVTPAHNYSLWNFALRSANIFSCQGPQ